MAPPWHRFSLRRSASSRRESRPARGLRGRSPGCRLEELEVRLTPAGFLVSSSLQVLRTDDLGGTGPARDVVFIESSVAGSQVLRQGVLPGSDIVVLDSGGDGLGEMAAFLAGRHGLGAIDIVAHGAPGMIALGSRILDATTAGAAAPELSVIGSALAPGGELDLWSCDVAAGAGGQALVGDLATATGAGIAAASHPIGAAASGGTWDLDTRLGGSIGASPFTASARAAYRGVLYAWEPAASMNTDRSGQTATLLNNGKVLVAGGDADGTLLSSAELYDPATDTWTSAGNMSTPRESHTATLLADGKVLVTGGIDKFANALSSSELYDPATNTWSQSGTLLTPRSAHTATLLNNGHVLVTGGFEDGSWLSSAELYDPATDTWSLARSMSTPRSGHTATLLANGQVLVVGGELSLSGTLASAELYDPVANAWSSAGSMSTARESHTATLLNNGQVLVVGGVAYSHGTYLSSAELYDPASKSWSVTGSMAAPRTSHAAVLLSNGQVLVSGGFDGVEITSSAETFNPLTGTWSSAGNMSAGREFHTATLLNDGRVLIAGSPASAGSPDTDLFDPAGNAWSFTSSMPFATAFPATVLLGNGKVLVAGGDDGHGYASSADLFDPATNTWSPTGSMKVGRGFFNAVLLGNGKVLVAGGFGPSVMAGAELYDPTTNSWSSAGNMTTPRALAAATVLANGKVLVVGGQNASAPTLSSTDLYDPATNSWSSAAPMLYPTSEMTATTLQSGKVLVTSGFDGTGLTPAQLYDPTTNTWSTAGTMITLRDAQTATLLNDGRVLVVGGGSEQASGLSSSEIYDPTTNTWSALENLNVPRLGNGATILPDGDVFVAGGADNGSRLSSAERYEFPHLAPAITSANHATFLVGQADQFTVTATGDPTPTFQVTAGTLPQGLDLSSSGLLSGTPASGTGGIHTFTIAASNTAGTVDQSFTLTVDEAAAITSADQATFTAGQAVQLTVTATGFPAPTLSESPNDTLPTGVTFNPSTGVLGGTLAAGSAGVYTLHFTAHNGAGADATQTFTLTVNAQATIAAVSVGWGTRGTSSLQTAGDGLRLLPPGRNTDLPWLNINQISITLNQAAVLLPADVKVTGINVADYGPVTISGSGTQYTITLGRPIAGADRVTVTIGNANIATFTRRLDVLPGDFNDNGMVDAGDLRSVFIASLSPTYIGLADINGDGVVDSKDVNLVRQLAGSRLPPM